MPVDDRPGLLAPALDPYGFVWTVTASSAARPRRACAATARRRRHLREPAPRRLAGGVDGHLRDGTRMLLSMINGVGGPELWVHGIIRGDDNLPRGARAAASQLLNTGTPGRRRLGGRGRPSR